MRALNTSNQNSGTLSTAIGLLVASLSCIAILSVAVTQGGGGISASLNMRELLIIGVLAGVVIFAGTASLIMARVDHRDKQT